MRGLYRREPAIDFALTQGVIPDALPDLDVLQLAAEAGRVLVARDEAFQRFCHVSPMSWTYPCPPGISIGAAIEGLLFAGLSWTAEEMQNQMRWLPQ